MQITFECSACGALLQLVTGKLPFAAATEDDTLAMRESTQLPDPREHVQSLSDGCVALLAIMMAVDHADRHASWKDLIVDLGRVQSGHHPAHRLVNAESSTVLYETARVSYDGSGQKKILVQHSEIEGRQRTGAHSTVPRRTVTWAGVIVLSIAIAVGIGAGIVMVKKRQREEAAREEAARSVLAELRTKALALIESGQGDDAPALVRDYAGEAAADTADARAALEKDRNTSCKASSPSSAGKSHSGCGTGRSPRLTPERWAEVMVELKEDNRSLAADPVVQAYGGEAVLNLAGQTERRTISALEGAPLTHIDLSGTRVSSLSPLRGMPLQKLNIAMTEVRDLAPLHGMPLSQLNITQCEHVTDLAPLMGSTISTLYMIDCGVSDVSPLADLPLRYLRLNRETIDDLTPVTQVPGVDVDVGED